MDKPMYDRTMVETDISLSLVPMVIVSAFMIAISCRGCSMGGGGSGFDGRGISCAAAAGHGSVLPVVRGSRGLPALPPHATA